jgi:DNA-binding LytR/AlgR family response regulator
MRSPSAEPLLNLDDMDDCVFIPIRVHHYERVRKRDIIYFQAEGNWVDLVTTTQTYRLSTNIGQIVEQIDTAQFIRISRQHVVNLHRVTALLGNDLRIDADVLLPIGRKHRSDVIERLPILRMKADATRQTVLH